MEVNVSRDKLAEVLSVVTKASPSNTALPILSGILMETPDESTLKLACTDLQLFVEHKIPSINVVPGKVVVPAKLLSELIKRLPSGNLSLSYHSPEVGLIIKIDEHSKTEFNIKSFDYDEFPPAPILGAENKLICTNSVLRSLIKSTAFAASSEESRAFLTGIYTIVEDDHLKMVATDSWRLAYRQYSLDIGKHVALGYSLIPAKALTDLSKALPESEDVINISFSNTHVSFESENFKFITRLIEGQFPNYKAIMPKSHKTELMVSRAALLSACDRASLLVRDRVSLIKMSNTMEHLVITSSSPEMGQGYEEIPIQCEGEEIKVVLDSRYLIDALKAMQGDEVIIRLQGSQQAIFLLEKDTQEFIQIIMPVKVPV